MKEMGDIEILFVAGFGPIVNDTATSRKLYQDVLDIPFKEEKNGYLHTDALQGSKEFALWPLSQSCPKWCPRCHGRALAPWAFPYGAHPF